MPKQTLFLCSLANMIEVESSDHIQAGSHLFHVGLVLLLITSKEHICDSRIAVKLASLEGKLCGQSFILSLDIVSLVPISIDMSKSKAWRNLSWPN